MINVLAHWPKDIGGRYLLSAIEALVRYVAYIRRYRPVIDPVIRPPYKRTGYLRVDTVMTPAYVCHIPDQACTGSCRTIPSRFQFPEVANSPLNCRVQPPAKFNLLFIFVLMMLINTHHSVEQQPRIKTGVTEKPNE
jgi:hypothetical protein